MSGWIDRRGVSRAAVAGIALVVLMVFAAALGLASAAPGRAVRHAPVRVRILSPRPGAALPARPLLIRLRLGRRAHGLGVKLNGRSIAAYFSRRRHGVRRLRVSPSHGLRYGRNVLRVSARRGRKGRRRIRVVRFRIKAGRPLAAAGLDRVATAGDRLRLDGTESKLHPSAHGRKAKLRYRWTVVRRRRPRGRRRPAAQAVRLSNRNSPTPIVTPTAMGGTTLRLTVTGPGGETGSDLVNVRADPPPSVRLETGVRQGNQSGIKLGSPINEFIPGENSKWLQLFVFKRKTLEFVSKKGYDCPQATEHPAESEGSYVKPCVTRVQADLAKLEGPGHPYLVIAANLPGEAQVEPPVAVGAALSPNVQSWNWWPADAVIQRGTFAAVFSPGAPASDSADQVAVDPTQPDTGMIADNLARDNEGNYSLVTGFRHPFETQAPESSPSQNVVAIGTRKFVQPLPPDSKGGFQVVVVDGRTLEGESHWFETHGSGSGLRGMYETLNRANQPARAPFSHTTLVFVASRGDPSVRMNDSTYPWFDRLGGEIEEAGGTRSRFFAALIGKLSKQNSYTLLGEAGRSRGAGSEALGAGPASPASRNTAPLTGVLSRTGPNLQYRVESANPPAPEGKENLSLGATQLLQVASQPPTQWPEHGNPGRTAAIKNIGLRVLGTDTPRTRYWTVVYKLSTWQEIRQAIEKLSFPATAQKFSKTDFGWAKAELLQEIKWLNTTYTYAEELAQPFSESEFASWAALKGIAAKVRAYVAPPSAEAQAQAQAKEIWQFALNLGKSAPLVGKVIGAANAIYGFAMAESALNEQSTESSFNVKVGEIGEAFVKRLEAARKLLTNQLPDAIVSDYGRLKTTGSCASAVAENWSSCPFEHENWEFSQDDERNAPKTLAMASRAAAYSAILPAKYNAYELPLGTEQQARVFAGLTFGVVCHWPFAGSPATAQYARPVFQQIGVPEEERKETWAVTALGYLEGQGTVGKPWQMRVPAAQLTQRIFGEGESENESNLGLDREDFYIRSFRPVTDLHYPWRTSKAGWLSRCINGPSGG